MKTLNTILLNAYIPEEIEDLLYDNPIKISQLGLLKKVAKGNFYEVTYKYIVRYDISSYTYKKNKVSCSIAYYKGSSRLAKPNADYYNLKDLANRTEANLLPIEDLDRPRGV